jgi:hypothetical protein
MEFALWYDTEPSFDAVVLESSGDAGLTWTPVPFTLRSGRSTVDTSGTVSGWGGRRWQAATASLPGAAALLLRWRYRTDAALQGRGGYVDAIRIRAGRRLLYDESRPADAALLRADGCTPSAD